MLSSSPELIWKGRIHLGDEPGIFGDAEYAGISLELPVTLEKTDPHARRPARRHSAGPRAPPPAPPRFLEAGDSGLEGP